jgi:hypothetical protein
MMTALIAATLFTAAPQADRPVASVAGLALHSAFWPNLHHVLYAATWARRPAGGTPRALAGALVAPLDGDLTDDERRVWEAAVAYYERELVSRDLLFDRGMIAVNDALAAAGDALPQAGLADQHWRVLEAAAPVYRRHWWPTHDRQNQEWIAQALERVRVLAPAVPDRLATLYGTPWFAEPVRVDVVWVGNRQGAYTTLGPTHITVSASNPGNQGWAAAEILFHEASHALVRPIATAFAEALRAVGKDAPVLWHVALFHLTGEVTREAIEARGEAYEPYLYATGLFDRAWPQYRAAIEREWAP